MAYATTYSLFSAQSVDGNSSAIDWPGGRGIFVATGTFGSGTCKLQFSIDGGTTYVGVDSGSDTYCTLTGAGAGGFELPVCKIRANLAGATAASLNASAASTVA